MESFFVSCRNMWQIFAKNYDGVIFYPFLLNTTNGNACRVFRLCLSKSTPLIAKGIWIECPFSRADRRCCDIVWIIYTHILYIRPTRYDISLLLLFLLQQKLLSLASIVILPFVWRIARIFAIDMNTNTNIRGFIESENIIAWSTAICLWMVFHVFHAVTHLYVAIVMISRWLVCVYVECMCMVYPWNLNNCVLGEVLLKFTVLKPSHLLKAHQFYLLIPSVSYR